MRVGEAVMQQRAERVRIAVAHRLEAALLELENSVLGHARLPLMFCAQRSAEFVGWAKARVARRAYVLSQAG
jgi:hypothetical protein